MRMKAEAKKKEEEERRRRRERGFRSSLGKCVSDRQLMIISYNS